MCVYVCMYVCMYIYICRFTLVSISGVNPQAGTDVVYERSLLVHDTITYFSIYLLFKM